MNNKGFTLIELLVVVVILGMIGTIITVSLTKTLKDTNQDSCDDFVKELEDAACVYVSKSDKVIVCERNNCAPIKLDYLIEDGLVDSEIDVCTGREINKEETVSVTWNEDGEKICHYNGERVYAR